MPLRPPTTILAGLATAAVLGGGAGAGIYAVLSPGSTTRTVVQQVPVPVSTASAPTSPAQSQPASATGLTVAQIYRQSYQGVVEITVTTSGGSFPGSGGSSQAQGSGFVYDAQGDVITNQHVVSGAQSISVRFWNDAVYSATLVGSDASTDIAVIRVKAPAAVLHPLSIGDSTALQVGDGVIAIGSPFGLEETVTSGIVSALHRQMTAPNQFTIDDSIQTDAAINHGNSGGPLLNMQGRVIGVNAQIQSDSGGSDGVGFAIPSATVLQIARQLVSSGKVEHAFLGVSIEDVPAAVASQLGLVQGAEVTGVRSGTPASAAGLHGATGERTIRGQTYPIGGDVITAVDGAKAATADALRALIDTHHPGDKVKLTVVRNGATRTVTVTLGTRPS